MNFMTLADGYDPAIQLSPGFYDSDEQMAGKFGRFLRKAAGTVGSVYGMIPGAPGANIVAGVTSAYAASPERRGAIPVSPPLEPAPMPGPPSMPFAPGEMFPAPAGMMLPMPVPKPSFLTPKNIALAGLGLGALFLLIKFSRNK